MLSSSAGLQRATFASAIVFIATISPVMAKNWNIVSGNWNVPANWSPAAVPTAGEAVNIVFTNGVARTVTYDVAAPSLGLLTIDLTGAGTTTNTLSMTSNLVLQASAIFVGGYNGITSTQTNGRGALAQSNGSTVINTGSDLVVGYGSGSTGTYTLSLTAALTASQSEFIGYSGTGTFTQSAGTNTLNVSSAGSLDLGAIVGATGNYNLSGGTLTANTPEYIGDGGTGNFVHSGGTNMIQGAGRNLWLGHSNTGVGNYTLSNAAALTVSGDLILGNVGTGTGTLTIQNAASVTVANNLTINPHGTVNMSGGTLHLNGYSRAVGGVFNYTAGTIQLTGDRTMGTDSTITNVFGATPTITAGKSLVVDGAIQLYGTTNVNGGTLKSLAGVFNIGLYTEGSGTLSISNGGTVTAAADVKLGTGGGSSGTVIVDGPTSSLSTPTVFEVANLNDGTLQITNGGTVTSGSGKLASYYSGSHGLVTLSGAGSKWMITGGLQVGQNGPGTINIQTGSLLYVGGLLEGNGSSAINLNGGTLRFDSMETSFEDRVSFSSGTIQLSGNRTVGSDAYVDHFFGSPNVIPTGKQLKVEGIATLGASSSLTLSGGTLSGSTLLLSPGSQLLSTLPSQATGAVLGQVGSVIDATLGNLTIGDSSKVNGFYTNGSILVGAHVVTLADSNDAVLDSAALMSLGNTTTAGTVNAANGLTLDFGGNVTGFGTISTPNSIAKPLINNGHISGNSASQKITLNGYVKGAGTFDNVTTTGTFSPGLSPAIVQTSNFSLASTSTLVMELGSTAPGSGYDQIQNAGTLMLGGTLQVSLISGFTPTSGNSFDLFNWGNVSGTFSSLSLPALTSGLTWNTSQLYTTGVLSVASAGILGDYNNNGTVEAGDYILYRKYAGTTHALPNDPTGGTIGTAQYTTWRSNFGKPPGSGTASLTGSEIAVPEPSAAWIAAFVCLVALASRGNARRHLIT